jgi:hypothetical protein
MMRSRSVDAKMREAGVNQGIVSLPMSEFSRLGRGKAGPGAALSLRTSLRYRKEMIPSLRWVGARTPLAVTLLAVGSCMPSQQDVQTAQALQDLGVAFNDLRLVQQEQQDRIDSLVQALARQDSTLRTLANLAGVALR